MILHIILFYYNLKIKTDSIENTQHYCSNIFNFIVMIILSDNNRVAWDNLGKNYVRLENPISLPHSVINVMNRILTSDNPQLFNSDNMNFWEYLFLTEFTKESQFDIINGLISENIEAA